jgi:hypothetical protein
LRLSGNYGLPGASFDRVWFSSTLRKNANMLSFTISGWAMARSCPAFLISLVFISGAILLTRQLNTATVVIPAKAGIRAPEAGCRIKSGMTPLRIKLPG